MNCYNRWYIEFVSVLDSPQLRQSFLTSGGLDRTQGYSIVRKILLLPFHFSVIAPSIIFSLCRTMHFTAYNARVV